MWDKYCYNWISISNIVSSKVWILNEYDEIVPKASQGATDKGHPGKEAKEESAKTRRGRPNTYEHPNVCQEILKFSGFWQHL